MFKGTRLYSLGLVILCAISRSVAAQDAVDPLQEKPELPFIVKQRFVIFSSGLLRQSLSIPREDLFVSFPYTQTDHEGKITTGVFNSRIDNTFTRPVTAWEVVSLQYGGRIHYVGGSIAFDTYHGSSLSLDYGIILNNAHPWLNAIIFKAQIDVAVGLDVRRLIGVIPNYGNITNVLGTRVDSMFTVRAGRYARDTYHGDRNRVYYLQTNAMLIPKLIAQYHPFRSGFFIELSASYVCPIRQHGTIGIDNANSNHDGPLQNINLARAGLITTFNDTPFTKAPFSFDGLQFGVKIGTIAMRKPKHPFRRHKKP